MGVFASSTKSCARISHASGAFFNRASRSSRSVSPFRPASDCCGAIEKRAACFPNRSGATVKYFSVASESIFFADASSRFKNENAPKPMCPMSRNGRSACDVDACAKKTNSSTVRNASDGALMKRRVLRGLVLHARNELLSGHAEDLDRERAHVGLVVRVDLARAVREADVGVVLLRLRERPDAKMLGQIREHLDLRVKPRMLLRVERAMLAAALLLEVREDRRVLLEFVALVGRDRFFPIRRRFTHRYTVTSAITIGGMCMQHDVRARRRGVLRHLERLVHRARRLPAEQLRDVLVVGADDDHAARGAAGRPRPSTT